MEAFTKLTFKPVSQLVVHTPTLFNLNYVPATQGNAKHSHMQLFFIYILVFNALSFQLYHENMITFPYCIIVL